MNSNYRIYGLKTLSRSGSLVFCGNCEKIIASINKQGYRYIKLSLTCSCGNCGSLEFSRGDSSSSFTEHIGNMPLETNGLAICKVCNTPIFGVIDSRVRSYAFYAECVCGEKYDLKSTFNIRLGETIKKLNHNK